MSDIPKGAILQRDKRTYAIVPRTPVGLVTPAILESLARVGRKYRIPVMKITSGQRIALVGLEAEQVDQVWSDLRMDVGPAVGLCVHYVQACPGNSLCSLGVRDSLGLGIELEREFVGADLPAKLKVGVSGCPMCCAESYVRDIGLVGRRNGWTMVVGGRSSGRPRIGDELAGDLSREQVLDLVARFLDYYREHSAKGQRVARFVEKTTIAVVREALPPS